MWFLAIISPLPLYLLPIFYAWNFNSTQCPGQHDPCLEWSHDGPPLSVLAVTALLAAASVGLPFYTNVG
ncbi:MAG: hypothetical protein IPK82_16860 [Polyangiaceae bacterium]|nr:hypothetical protein [Polyangiaceae bacterium]